MSPNYVLAVLKRFATRPTGGDVTEIFALSQKFKVCSARITT